jgi:EAL domain-containing protein (putative c-di-GMP-specific phosphodiesterase class I)
MIQALGARVLRDACRQLMTWHRQNMMLRLSVNLSVQQLQHDSWLSVVEEALKASGLPPRYLDLEITESVIITHPEKAVATLEKLKQMGVSITVDDFGTGYSSLSYLTRLPIQGVKIDQRFVHGLEQNRSDEAITLAIIALSHSIGLRVIAEGVETVAQYEFLKAHGCEEAQGYLISRPLEEPGAGFVVDDAGRREPIVGRQSDGRAHARGRPSERRARRERDRKYASSDERSGSDPLRVSRHRAWGPQPAPSAGSGQALCPPSALRGPAASMSAHNAGSSVATGLAPRRRRFRAFVTVRAMSSA